MRWEQRSSVVGLGVGGMGLGVGVAGGGCGRVDDRRV